MFLLKSRQLFTVIFLAASWTSVDGQELATAPSEAIGVTVELIEPGAAPRHEIRYGPIKGAKETLVMTMKMGQSITMNGQKLPMPSMPAQRFTIDFSIVDVSPKGDIHMEYEYTGIEMVDDPDNPSPVAAQIERMIKPLEGMTGSAVVTNRGFGKQADMTIPKDVAPMLRNMLDGMRDSMKNMSSPLPEEPVGVGGKWRVTQRLEMNGMKLKQTSICELMAVNEGSSAINMELTQDAEKQRVNSPMLPAGAQLTLESLDTEGSGRMVISPNSIVPNESQSKISSSSSMTVGAGGQNQAMATETTMEMTFQRAELEASVE